MDEIYDFLFVNGLAKGGGDALWAFDRNVIDGGVNGAGWMTRLSSGFHLVGHLDRGRPGALHRFHCEARRISRAACSDRIRQSYALVFFAGVLAFLGSTSCVRVAKKVRYG